MTALLIDTNVFSFLFKKDSRRELHAEDLLGKQLCLSFISVGELRLWAIERAWSQKRRESLEQAMLAYTILGRQRDGMALGRSSGAPAAARA